MNKKISVVIITILIAMTCIFVYEYVKNESPVYTFDYCGYHEQYKNYSEQFFNSPLLYLKNVISSIRNADYNCSPIVLILPFYIIFKKSRLGYILGISLFYVVPTIILTFIIIKKYLFNKNNENIDKNNLNIFLFFICIVDFLYTRWWSSTLRGLPDIIALIPIAIATFIFKNHSFLNKQKIHIPVLIGFLLYLCFLFRRYFVYAIIGFYVSMFIVELIKFLCDNENKKEKFINAFKNFAIAGCTTLMMVLLMQLPLIKTILNQNYSESYSAFQVSAKEHFINAINEFSIPILILAVVGVVYCLLNKEHRENGVFCVLNILVCYGTFMTVQFMGVHHYLTISLWVFILFIYGVYAVWTLLKNKILKNIWLCVILVIMILNFSTTYIFRNANVPILTQQNKYYKLHYENFDELQRLINDIDTLLNEKNVRFSVLASTDNLSDSLLDMTGTEKMKQSIVYTSAIDLRDGINFNSLMSEYIVVTDIPQLGISIDGQRIISVPNNNIVNKTSIGKAYSFVSGPYTLQDGVKAFIYKKDRAFTEEEVNEYMETFKKFYPKWREQYNKLDDAILMSERKLGDATGDVRRLKYETFYLSPGSNQTTYTLNLNKKIKSLKLKLYIDKNIDKRIENAGNVFVTIKADKDVLFENEVSLENSRELELDLNNKEKLTFIVDKNEYLSYDFLYADIIDVICND